MTDTKFSIVKKADSIETYIRELGEVRALCDSEKGVASAEEFYDFGYNSDAITVLGGAKIILKSKGRHYWNSAMPVTEDMAWFVFKLLTLYRCGNEELKIRKPDVPVYSFEKSLGTELDGRYLDTLGISTKPYTPEPQLELEAEEIEYEQVDLADIHCRLDALICTQDYQLQASLRTNELLTKIYNEIDRGNTYAEKTGEELDAALSYLRTNPAAKTSVQ